MVRRTTTITHKLIFIALILAAISFVGVFDASAIDTKLSHGWQFSIDMKNVSIEENKSINQNGKTTNNFVLKSDRYQSDLAVIIPISLAKTQIFNNTSMLNYIDKYMKYQSLSKLSIRPYTIAGTQGAFGRAYDNKTGSNVFLAYFPAWPSDSTSNRAVLIVSMLGEGSYRLFDTIHILKCPDRKEPLSQFLKSK